MTIEQIGQKLWPNEKKYVHIFYILNACFPDIVLTAMTVHLRYYLENNYNNIIVQSMVQIKVVLC